MSHYGGESFGKKSRRDHLIKSFLWKRKLEVSNSEGDDLDP